jgi:hypothetical protein
VILCSVKENARKKLATFQGAFEELAKKAAEAKALARSSAEKEDAGKPCLGESGLTQGPNCGGMCCARSRQPRRR